jgi:N-acyl-D-aspartate/D-glutamate deacylase
MDLVIRNGTVVDGSGATARVADVGIVGVDNTNSTCARCHLTTDLAVGGEHLSTIARKSIKEGFGFVLA